MSNGSNLPGDRQGGDVARVGFRKDQSIDDFLRVLRDSFNQGLLEFAHLAGAGGAGSGAGALTSTLYMCVATAGGIAAWTLPKDQFVVNVVPLSGSTNWTLSTTGVTYSNTHGVTSAVQLGLLGMYSTTQSVFLQKTLVRQGDKLILSNSSASVVDCLVFLTDT